MISEKEAETIRKADDAARQKSVIRPSKWMYWNVHVDGLEYTHDLIVEREGVFKECVEAIKMAKILGYQVATNTTVYKETDVQEIEQMFKFFSSLEVDGHTISPGYEYDAAKKDMVKRLGKQPKDFFLTRKMTRAEIREDPGMGQGVHHFRHAGLPGISRRQTRTDLHRLGHSDPQHQRLESAVLPDDRRPLRRLPGNARRRWTGKNTAWWTASRAIRVARTAWSIAATIPAARSARIISAATTGRTSNTTSARSRSRIPSAPELAKRAFNGVSIGKGHLAEAKAAINSPRAAMNGAQAVFSRQRRAA